MDLLGGATGKAGYILCVKSFYTTPRFPKMSTLLNPMKRHHRTIERQRYLISLDIKLN